MTRETVVCGVQQVGVGIYDVVEAYNWYIKAFGCDVMVVDDQGVAERMLPYTGGKPRPRRAVLACNIKGGGGFEVWQPMDGNITAPKEPVRIGDLGISVCKLKAVDVNAAYAHLSSVEGAVILTPVMDAPYGKKHFFLNDPYGNIFEVVEDDYVFLDSKGYTVGGTHGVIIGVTDMEQSLKYYAALLGYDQVVYDGTEVYEDFKALPGGDGLFRRVIITTARPLEGPLSELYGTACIELVQAFDRVPSKVFEGRWWGDPGFIQICFDVRNMEGMRERAKALGQDFVCDGGEDFKMDTANGRFTYVEDPDGTLIELVETFKIPVLKKLGIYLNLRNRADRAKLPSFVVKALRFMRVKSIHA
ncbi:MAG: VOC family protein [Bacteroidales bacterium]|nr:VOC family protein [Candidatus Cryptobacteroides onthequi]MCQ2164547.1 VOC family protein [Bacteroidales bacterium]